MAQLGDAIESEDNALKILVERIRRGTCVLILGPRVAVRADDPERTPLDELLAIELNKKLNLDGEEGGGVCRNLRHVAELYCHQKRYDRFELEFAAEQFYKNAQDATTSFHRDLAQLPFQLCVCASPDDAMFQAFVEINKSPQRAYYNFRGNSREFINKPSDKNPLVYHLFGHHQDGKSLVLTEGDLIDYLVAIVKGTPAIHDRVRSMLADPETALLFVGFGFHNWYLRVLLQAIGVYEKHTSKQVAFEDTQFFAHPDCRETVGFFSGERYIEFRPLQWEQFARQMRDLYLATKPTNSKATLAYTNRNISGPLAFLSYASEDRDTVERLADQLEARGVNVWQDQQDLRAGDDWDRVLVAVIEKRVDYFVVVQTPAMMSRVKGVFNEEIDVAIKQQKSMGEGNDGLQFRFVIPVKIGEYNSFSKLKGWHDIDVSTEAGVDRLARDILDDWTKRPAKTELAEGRA